MKKFLVLSALLILASGGGYFLVKNWGYVFSVQVVGHLESVERVTSQTAILGNTKMDTTPQDKGLFSFAVAIKSEDGEYFTASTEDRQWAATKVGQCVIARFFPYPPWNFEKSKTFHNARLIKIFDCPSTTE